LQEAAIAQSVAAFFARPIDDGLDKARLVARISSLAFDVMRLTDF
jgi:hypothetical protein